MAEITRGLVFYYYEELGWANIFAINTITAREEPDERSRCLGPPGWPDLDDRLLGNADTDVGEPGRRSLLALALPALRPPCTPQ